MKKKIKPKEVRKLENKVYRLERSIRSLTRNLGFSESETLEIKRQNDALVRQNEEQERIISMFKTCIDKTLLEKVLKDDYVRYLKAYYGTVERPNCFEYREGPAFKFEEQKKDTPQ